MASSADVGLLMKVLKHILGLLLGAFGVLCLLAAFGYFVQPEPESSGLPFWWIEGFLIGLGVVPIGGSYLLLRAELNLPTKPCPQCGGTESETAGVLVRNTNPWFAHFGGWLFAALWGASRERQVRCVACQSLYFTQTRASRIGGICLWIFILLLGLAAVFEFFVSGEGNQNGFGNDF